MKLKEFIKQLKQIAEKHGDDVEVTMADFLPVVRSVFCRTSPYNESVVVITDQNKYGHEDSRKSFKIWAKF